MRVLVIHAHPVETSFNRALFNTTVAALQQAGHEVDACNLYDEGFEAVLSREERLEYHEVLQNITPAITHRCEVSSSRRPRRLTIAPSRPLPS